MKKIISFLLAAVLLVSAVPMAYAAETTDYTNGTAVTYTATGTEEWTVTVPAQLAPGGSGTVTLDGTWASDRVVSVTADKNVVLTNSIKAADQKTLNVSFPGIDEYGSNTTSQTFTETVSVAGISDALFGTWSGRFYYNVAVYDAVDYLQVKYPFDYYSTMNLAVTDVNNGAIGASADVDKADAVAGIYTDENGGINVVLLQDTTEAARVETSVDMTINLGGHTLSTGDTRGIYVRSGDLVVDGQLSGSTISINQTGGNSARAIQIADTANCTINGGTYIGNSESGTVSCIMLSGTSNVSISNAKIIGTSNSGMVGALICQNNASGNINNCEITAISTTGDTYGVYCYQATLTINNCDITATVTNGDALGFQNNGVSTITNCNIKAYGNYLYGEAINGVATSYTSSSTGVVNAGTLTMNNCYVMGTFAGVNGLGTLYVNGGTYEGYGHGGFYFSGPDTTSYVQDATIRQCAMPDGYTTTLKSNNSGLYIGGGTGIDNISVYMDNCDIYGSSQPIVLRGSSNEQNNSLYISNSRINLDYTSAGVRIDNDTHKLYIGAGNNFTADNTTLPEVVVVTDETYTYNG